MGKFDTIHYEDRQMNEIAIQFKGGDCEQLFFTVGDKIKCLDGIYFDYKDEEDGGCFVVFNGVIVAVFSNSEPVLFNKWAKRMAFPDIEK